MTDDPIDRILRDAAARDRSVDVPEGLAHEIATRASAAPGPRRRWYRRRLAIILGAVILAGSATTIAVPDIRDAVSHAFGAFGDFFTGRGDAPGDPLVPGKDRMVPWLTDSADVSHPNVITEREGVRLIGYRQPSTEFACIALENVLSMCRPDGEWRATIRGEHIVDFGPVPIDVKRHRMAIYGIVDDTVASVAIDSVDGQLVRADSVTNGYVLSVDIRGKPRSVVAYGRDGRIIRVIRYAPVYWTIVQ